MDIPRVWNPDRIAARAPVLVHERVDPYLCTGLSNGDVIEGSAFVALASSDDD